MRWAAALEEGGSCEAPIRLDSIERESLIRRASESWRPGYDSHPNAFERLGSCLGAALSKPHPVWMRAVSGAAKKENPILLWIAVAGYQLYQNPILCGSNRAAIDSAQT